MPIIALNTATNLTQLKVFMFTSLNADLRCPNTIFSAISTRPPSSMASGSCWLEQLDPIPNGPRLPVDPSRHGRDEELARVDRRARRYQKLDDRDVMDTDHWAVNLPHWRTGRQWFRSKDAHGYSLGTGS